MRLSRELLQREAMATGFRVEILEKVAQLLDLLSGFDRHPYLKEHHRQQLPRHDQSFRLVAGAAGRTRPAMKHRVAEK